MKKRLVLFITSISIILSVIGCSSTETSQSKQLTIITTLFPQYDFTRQIVGDKANVVMLLKPGVESHSYEPTPADIIKINSSNLFIYTGEHMEPWAQSIINGIDNKDVVIVDASSNIPLGKLQDDEHEDHEEDKHEDDHGHNHDYDPHIWTDPNNAKMMVDNIVTALCNVDPENAQYYQTNASNYKMQLDELDDEFREIVKNSNRKEIIFGGHFAFYYFTKQYGLSLEAAYDSLSAETEPSVKVVSNIIDKIKNENIPVIYYEELSVPKVAKSISDETGAKMLLLHSAHNVSKDELKEGITYMSIMKQNAENLKEGLK